MSPSLQALYPFFQLSLWVAETRPPAHHSTEISLMSLREVLLVMITKACFLVFFLYFSAFYSVGFSILETASSLGSSKRLFVTALSCVFSLSGTSFLASFSLFFLRTVCIFQNCILSPLLLSTYSHSLSMTSAILSLLPKYISLFPDTTVQVFAKTRNLDKVVISSYLFCLHKPSIKSSWSCLLLTAVACPLIISFLDPKLLVIFSIFLCLFRMCSPTLAPHLL